jgi:SAM-dependent methyltransferase
MACVICGGVDRRSLYRLSNGDVVRCAGCGTVSRSRLIEGREAEELYDEDGYLDSPFFEALKTGATPDVEPYLVYGRVLQQLATRSEPGRLLDVGCSYGAFLEMAARAGWEPHGVDLSRKAVDYAARERGLRVVHGTLAQAGYPDGYFEAVTLWDVIEHVADPLAELREVRRVLAPGGTVVLFTINQRSLINRVGHWIYRLSMGRLTRQLVLLYDIHHNWFFGPETMRSLIRRVGGMAEPEFSWMDANVERWQTVPIPPLMLWGSRALDAASRRVGMRYRMIVFAGREREQPA